MPAAAAGDNEFYFARLAKCRAVRESKRTADSRAFIECHEGMEAALVALSPNRATRARDGSVVFPAHEAAVALARSLRGFVLSESACLRVCPHLEHMVVLLALIPLVTPATFPTTNWRIDLKLLRPPFPAAGSPAARVALGHLLKGVGALAWAPDELIDPAREALTAACMVLLNAQGSAIGAELAGLAADAGGSGPRLATVADLKIACLSHMTGPRNPNDDERLVAAELLLPLDPDDPVILGWAADAALCCERMAESLEYKRRAFAAARQRKDDLRTAEMGYKLASPTAMWCDAAPQLRAAPGGLPRPSELLEALSEADAALERCRKLLPSMWVISVDAARTIAVPYLETLQLMEREQGDSLLACKGTTPATRAAVQALLQNASMDRLALSAMSHECAKASIMCYGCEAEKASLRKCSGCKLVQYCSRECQKAHWPSHKAACKAAQRVRQQE